MNFLYKIYIRHTWLIDRFNIFESSNFSVYLDNYILQNQDFTVFGSYDYICVCFSHLHPLILWVYIKWTFAIIIFEASYTLYLYRWFLIVLLYKYVIWSNLSNLETLKKNFKLYSSIKKSYYFVIFPKYYLHHENELSYLTYWTINHNFIWSRWPNSWNFQSTK